MVSRTSTSSVASAALRSPQDGRDSGRSSSVKSSLSARKSSRQGSGLLPTPTAGSESSRRGRWGGLSGGTRHRASLKNLFSFPTSETSTAPDSEEQPYLPGAFHASRRPSPGSDEERRMTVGSGRKLLEYLPTSTRPGPSLRTLLEFLASSMAWSSRNCFLRWNAKATKSGRLLFRLVPSTPHTGGTGSGLLPTMRAGKTTDEKEEAWTRRKDRGGVATPPLALAIRLLKTPSSVETEGGVMEIRPGCDGHYKLRDQIAMLPTPKGTPSGPDYARARREGSGGDDFQTFGERRGLKLQPVFVEWMMGYPLTWTNLNLQRLNIESKGSKPSAMPSFHKSRIRSSRGSRE